MHIIGASIPRSGHHFFIRLVKSILQKDMLYCEFYSQQDCCGEFPCKKRNRKPLTFQKNHDFDFSLPIIDDQEYLVQIRDPAPQILSHIEIASPLVKSNVHERNYWLSGRINYFWRFHEKWVGKPRANFMMLDYDDLAMSPAAVLGMFFQRYNLDVPVHKIVSATDAVSKKRSLNGKVKEYAPRKIEPKDILDLDTLAIVESAILSEVPSLQEKRKLDRAKFCSSHLYWHAKALSALNSNDAGKGYDWARFCVEEVPDNPMYHLTLARICNRLGHTEELAEVVAAGLSVAGDVGQFKTRLNRMMPKPDPEQDAPDKTATPPGEAAGPVPPRQAAAG